MQDRSAGNHNWQPRQVSYIAGREGGSHHCPDGVPTSDLRTAASLRDQQLEEENGQNITIYLLLNLNLSCQPQHLIEILSLG